jgi:hypothetical protein
MFAPLFFCLLSNTACQPRFSTLPNPSEVESVSLFGYSEPSLVLA